MKVFSVSVTICTILTLSRAIPLNSTLQSGQCVNQTQNCANSSALLGGFCPKCDDKGNFLPQQCSRLTGYCWCVNITNGQEIPNTRKPPGSVPDCGTAVGNEWMTQIPPTEPGPTCVNCGRCKYQKQNCTNVPGAFCPKCDNSGNFLPTQCSRSCWCVDVNSGEKIPNTTVPLGTEPDCGNTTDHSDKQQPVPKKPDDGHDSGDCPDGWSTFGKRCFTFIDTPKAWVDAEVYCTFDRASLASVHSDEENRFIMSLTRGDAHNFPQTWLGGFDAIHPGYWMWSDGSEFNYRNWNDDHTNHDSDNNEDDDNQNEEDDEHNYANDDDKHDDRDSNHDEDDENSHNDDESDDHEHDKHENNHDDIHDDNGKNCLKMNYQYNLKWFYASCRDSLPFVCVKNIRSELFD